MLVAQNGVCAQCGGLGPFIAEHDIPVALGNQDKPTRLLCKLVCAAKKTTIDRQRIHKSDRQGLRTGQQARLARTGPKLKSNGKLQARGFQKDLTRGFDGKVRKR